MILVLGGTTEGRQLAVFLSDKGFEVLISVVSTEGVAAIREYFKKSRVQDSEKAILNIEKLTTADNDKIIVITENVAVRVGELTASAMEKLIFEKKITAIVDATHPFAEKISRIAYGIATDYQLPYLRYQRPVIDYPQGVNFVEDFYLVSALMPRDTKVFAAIGSKHLADLMADRTFQPHQIFVRILPSSLESVLALGIPRENIIVAKGPFSLQDNLRDFALTQASCLITKASGVQGGEGEKIKAALDLGMKVVVVKRPSKPGQAWEEFSEIAIQLYSKYC